MEFSRINRARVMAGARAVGRAVRAAWPYVYGTLWILVMMVAVSSAIIATSSGYEMLLWAKRIANALKDGSGFEWINPALGVLIDNAILFVMGSVMFWLSWHALRWEWMLEKHRIDERVQAARAADRQAARARAVANDEDDDDATDEERCDALVDALRRVADALRRGDLKYARTEIERALEDVA